MEAAPAEAPAEGMMSRGARAGAFVRRVSEAGTEG